MNREKGFIMVYDFAVWVLIACLVTCLIAVISVMFAFQKENLELSERIFDLELENEELLSAQIHTQKKLNELEKE